MNLKKENAECKVLLRDALAAETTKQVLARGKVVALEEQSVGSRKEGTDSKDRYVLFIPWVDC